MLERMSTMLRNHRGHIALLSTAALMTSILTGCAEVTASGIDSDLVGTVSSVDGNTITISLSSSGQSSTNQSALSGGTDNAPPNAPGNDASSDTAKDNAAEKNTDNSSDTAKNDGATNNAGNFAGESTDNTNNAPQAPGGNGQMPSGQAPDGSGQALSGNLPEKLDGDNNTQKGESPDKSTDNSEEQSAEKSVDESKEKTEGNSADTSTDNSGDAAQNGGQQPQGGGQMPPGGMMPGSSSSTGGTQRVTVDSKTQYYYGSAGDTDEENLTTTKDSGSGQDITASLDEIDTGDLIEVVVEDGQVTKIILLDETQQSGNAQNGGMPGGQQGSEESADLTGAYTVDGKEETAENQEISSETADESAVLVENGGSLTLRDSTLTKTGDSSNVDQSNFSGLNAIFAANGGSTANISDTTLTSDAEGANGIFSTGGNTKVTVDDVTINTTGNSSRGLDATYGGTIEATDVDITTTGAHCAPIATDRGGGTVTVDGATLTSSGDGSPNIYCTGDITVKNATGTAKDSQTCVIEGKNTLTIEDCDLTGAGKNGVMLYQSTSGDVEEGTATFNSVDSTLTTTSDGPMFYITNTTAVANLTNTTLNFSSGELVNCAGNETNNWGTPGSNGGQFTLNATSQTLKGDMICDEISTIALNLTEKSAYTGTINGDNSAKEFTVSLDESSTLELTGDSYVTVLTNADTDCSNIVTNGHTLYYDASNDANSWLDGQTITLDNGGTIAPMK